jgi:hypothetical protein
MVGDDGEVLQGLNERWTFMGANAMEWACGLVVFLMISLFAATPGRAMPFMLIGWVLTTTSLASLRRSFPDEERGVRNAICAAAGVPPMGIPAPASLQPVWSQCPIRDLPENCKFKKLGLDLLFPSLTDQYLDEFAD